MTAIRDRLARPLGDLRVSVTDRCNLRCSYCMPKEVFGREFVFMPAGELLSFEEIARLARLFAGLGVNTVRLTGGEPLLRRELERLVAMLAQIEGIHDIALTTNGILLADKVAALRRAGLTRVTISLDALDERVCSSIADRPFPLARVLGGIDAAADAGLGPVKVNMVVRRSVNDHCVLQMAERFRHREEVVRFIEYMDVGATNGWRADEVVPAAEIRMLIDARWPLQALAHRRPGEVATRYRYRDGGGEVGFIHSVSQPFCATCTRARLSADGKLYTCLFASRGADLRTPLRAGATDRELTRRIGEVWSSRRDRYSAERDATARSRGPAGPSQPPARPAEDAKVEMSYIGG
jgi:GTP 3',8-cyclase